MLTRMAVRAIMVFSLAGSRLLADELPGFDGQAFFLAPDPGSARPAVAAALPRAAPPDGFGRRSAAGEATLRLAWLDPAETAGRSAVAARGEAARVFKSMGLAVSWRRATSGEPTREGEVRVILLDRLALNDRRANVLGSTPARFDGSPFVWIHVPGVRQALGQPAGGAGADLELRESLELGVALGRVIAHEVVHALAPSAPHGEGLMKSSLSRRELAGSALPVSPELVALVRDALAGRPLPAPADTGLLAAEHARDERQR